VPLQPRDAALEPEARDVVLGGEVIEVADERQRLDPDAGVGRQVAGEVAQAEDAPLRAVQQAKRLDQRAQRHRLIEHQRLDRSVSQSFLGDDVLEHRER